MGMPRERGPDLQLKMLESGKSNGRNGKAGKRNENLVLLDVLRAKSREREKRRAGKSHVIEQRQVKNNFEHSRRERGRKGRTTGHTPRDGNGNGKDARNTHGQPTHTKLTFN